MRIRKRNNIIYWLGFSLYFVSFLILILYALFKNDNFNMSLSDFYESFMASVDMNDLRSPVYFLDTMLNLPLFTWIRTILDFLIPDAFYEDYTFSRLIGSFIAWVLFYNEIWLFIRVFLWFFDIPNEILERSVNLV